MLATAARKGSAFHQCPFFLLCGTDKEAYPRNGGRQGGQTDTVRLAICDCASRARLRKLPQTAHSAFLRCDGKEIIESISLDRNTFLKGRTNIRILPLEVHQDKSRVQLEEQGHRKGAARKRSNMVKKCASAFFDRLKSRPLGTAPLFLLTFLPFYRRYLTTFAFFGSPARFSSFL